MLAWIMQQANILFVVLFRWLLASILCKRKQKSKKKKDNHNIIEGEKEKKNWFHKDNDHYDGMWFRFPIAK